MRRLRPFAALLVLGLWSPGQFWWALALLATADGSHHASMRSVNGDMALVLHHHDISSDADHESLDADDHPHGDHVIHGAATDRGLAASRLAMRAPALHLCVDGGLSSPAVVCDRSPVRVAVLSPIGPSPPLRTVVLRI